MSTVSVLPKGTGIVRYLRCLAMNEGRITSAVDQAEQYRDTPAVGLTLKAIVNPMLANGNPLSAYGLAQEFFELYRSASLVGRLMGFFRPAVFKTLMPVEEDSLSNPAWIPEAGMIPVRAFRFDQTYIDPFLMGMITVVSKQLLARSTPSADSIVRRILVSAAAKFVDSEFLSTSEPEAGVSPGGVCYGAQTHSTTGSTAAAIAADLSSMAAKLETWAYPIWAMKPKTFSTLAAYKLIEFLPGGPLLCGFPVFHTQASPAQIALVDAGSILLADEGASTIDYADEASITMGDGGSPESERALSLYNSDLAAFRVERQISWQRPNSGSAVSMAVNY